MTILVSLTFSLLINQGGHQLPAPNGGAWRRLSQGREGSLLPVQHHRHSNCLAETRPQVRSHVL